MPCPSPAPAFIEASRSAGRELTLVVAHDADLELEYFQKCEANVLTKDIDLVDAGCNIASQDPLSKHMSE